MTLCTRADNNKELINRIGYSYLHSDNARKKASKSKSKPIIAYNKYSVKLYRAIKDTVVFGFDDSSISKACKGKYSYNRGHLYSGYKWHYINYKHSRKYRIKDGEYIVKNNR